MNKQKESLQYYRQTNKETGKYSTKQTDKPCLLRPGLFRSHVMITPLVAAEATTFSAKTIINLPLLQIPDIQEDSTQHRWTDRQTARQTQTSWQRDRERQTDRQRDRLRQTQRHTFKRTPGYMDDAVAEITYRQTDRPSRGLHATSVAL